MQPATPAATEWELAAACLNHRNGMGQPDCVGFTRDQWGGGVLWRAMTNPFDGWSKWMVTPTTPCGGMYVKGACCDHCLIERCLQGTLRSFVTAAISSWAADLHARVR